MLSAYRSSLIVAASFAALSGVMGHVAHAQSRPDLDALIYGAATKVADPIPAEPNVIMQQAPQDASSTPDASQSMRRGLSPSSSGGALAALGDMFRRSASATGEPLDAQAAMTKPDGSERGASMDAPSAQAQQIQLAQSQGFAPRARDADDTVSVDSIDAGPTATNRRGRVAGLRPSLSNGPLTAPAGSRPSSRGHDGPVPARYALPEVAVPYDPSYRVDAGDRLRIVVFGQDGLTNTYQIGASGAITMPLIGSVPARGRTPAELAGAITARLRDGFIRAPSVAVEIEAYRPFFILGEVAAPGQYPYVPNMSVESAIAIAGGFSPRAKRDSVTLTHAMPDGLMRAIVPVDTPLSPGDTIMVGERWF